MKKVRSGVSQDTVLIRIEDIDAYVEPDSGASANMMNEYQFTALKHRSQEIKELEPSRDTLKTFQSDLTFKGEFTAILRNNNRGTESKFLVIQGKMDSPLLLSKNTLLELGMLKIDSEGALKETIELRIKTMKTRCTCISRDRMFSGQKHGGEDKSQARNGSGGSTCGSETTPCTLSPAETT